MICWTIALLRPETIAVSFHNRPYERLSTLELDPQSVSFWLSRFIHYAIIVNTCSRIDRIQRLYQRFIVHIVTAKNGNFHHQPCDRNEELSSPSRCRRWRALTQSLCTSCSPSVNWLASSAVSWPVKRDRCQWLISAIDLLRLLARLF